MEKLGWFFFVMKKVNLWPPIYFRKIFRENDFTQNFAIFFGFLEHIMYSGVFTFTHPLTMNYILFFYCSTRKAIEGISTLKSKMDT